MRAMALICSAPFSPTLKSSNPVKFQNKSVSGTTETRAVSGVLLPDGLHTTHEEKARSRRCDYSEQRENELQYEYNIFGLNQSLSLSLVAFQK